jgi:hypothetical protein
MTFGLFGPGNNQKDEDYGGRGVNDIKNNNNNKLNNSKTT